MNNTPNIPQVTRAILAGCAFFIFAHDVHSLLAENPSTPSTPFGIPSAGNASLFTQSAIYFQEKSNAPSTKGPFNLPLQGGTVEKLTVYDGQIWTEHIYDASGKKIKTIEYYYHPKPKVEKVPEPDEEAESDEAKDPDYEKMMKEVDPEGISKLNARELAELGGKIGDPAVKEKLDKISKAQIDYRLKTRLKTEDFKLGHQFVSLAGKKSQKETLHSDLNLRKEAVDRINYTLQKLKTPTDKVIIEYQYNKNNKLIGSVAKDLMGETLYFTKYVLDKKGKITKATDLDPITQKPVLMHVYDDKSQIEKFCPYEKGKIKKGSEFELSYYDNHAIKSISTIAGAPQRYVSYFSQDNGMIIKQEMYENKKLSRVVEGNNNPDLPRGMTRRITWYKVKNNSILETYDPEACNLESPVSDYSIPGFENVKKTIQSFTFKNKRPYQVSVTYHRVYKISGELYDINILFNEPRHSLDNCAFTKIGNDKSIAPILGEKNDNMASLKKKVDIYENNLSKRYQLDIKTNQIIDKDPDYEKKNKLDRLYLLGNSHKVYADSLESE